MDFFKEILHKTLIVPVQNIVHSFFAGYHLYSWSYFQYTFIYFFIKRNYRQILNDYLIDYIAWFNLTPYTMFELTRNFFHSNIQSQFISTYLYKYLTIKTIDLEKIKSINKIRIETTIVFDVTIQCYWAPK